MMLECKHKVLGPARSDFKEIVVLNRTLRWEKAGISIEADAKHAELVVKQLKLQVQAKAKRACRLRSRSEQPSSLSQA